MSVHLLFRCIGTCSDKNVKFLKLREEIGNNNTPAFRESFTLPDIVSYTLMCKALRSEVVSSFIIHFKLSKWFGYNSYLNAILYIKELLKHRFYFNILLVHLKRTELFKTVSNCFVVYVRIKYSRSVINLI